MRGGAPVQPVWQIFECYDNNLLLLLYNIQAYSEHGT